MESYKSESYSDDESDSSSTPEAPSTNHVRHVALPASALHGFTHEAPKPAPEVPALESVFAAEQQRRQAEAAHAERKEDDDESDEDDDTVVALPHTQLQATPEPTTEGEHITPIAAVAEALETFADEPEQSTEVTATTQTPTATSPQAAPQSATPHHEAPAPLPPTEHEPSVHTTPAELTPEAVDEQFKQMVELNLSDLQDLDLPLNESELHSAPPAAAESVDFPLPPLPDSAPSAVPSPAAEAAPDWQTSPNAQPNTPQSDFEAWESEMADQNLPPFPEEQPPIAPYPNAESAATTPLAESGMEVKAREAFRPFARVFSAAELLAINNKLQYAEAAARATGDAVTGLVAGWALARTFKNRRMIREQERETKKQSAKQERTNTELTEQNAQLRQRLDRAENAPAANMAQQAMPNRFRPVAGAAGETLGTKPPQAEKQPTQAPEHGEAAIRQETLETPPEHEVVRSGWHSIELDSKTGKAVESPTGFEYGEAFQRERRSEQLQDKTQDASTPQATAAAQAGMSYMSAQPGMQPAPPLLSAPTPKQQLGAGKRSPADLIKGTSKQLASSLGTPWFWLALIFLVMVFFGAALL